ncbi:MAG: hypothetical protein ABF806_04665 [Bifidobacterium psychraerophilum]|uniref:hypothetical protein n=1 Tax=Bifidobacterium psychraerophilum TaxID=218140 RepID=UPI0039E8F62C
MPQQEKKPIIFGSTENGSVLKNYMNKQKVVFNLVETASKQIDLVDLYTKSMRARFGSGVKKDKCRRILDAVNDLKTNPPDKESIGKISAKFRRFDKGLPPDENINVYIEEATRILDLSIPSEVFLASLLSTAIADFEFFFAETLRNFYLLRPQSLNDTNITLKDLREAGSIEAISMITAERRITDLMYGPFAKWVQSLERTCHISISALEPLIPTITEAIGRRNAHVHNEGRVNSRYFSYCSQEQRGNYTEGQKLDIDNDYITNFLDYAVAAAAIISCEMSRKQEKEKIEQFEPQIGSITYEFNLTKRYLSSVLYGKYAKGLSISDGYSSLIVRVNDWVARKQLGEETWKQEVEDFSTGEKDDMFKLAKMALLGKKKESGKLFVRLLVDRKLREEYIYTWPLLEEIRPTLETLLQSLRERPTR